MPDGTTFWRKTTTTYDTEVDSVFGDYANGNSALATVQGGKNPINYILDTTVAPKPFFGEAELSDLRLHLYGDSISVGESSLLPKASIFKMRNPMGDNEGNVGSRVPVKDIVVITAREEPSTVWQVETFDKQMTAEQIEDNFDNIQGSIVHKTEPYLTLDRAWGAYNQRTTGGVIGGPSDKQDMFEKHGTTHDDMGKIIFLQGAKNWPGDWKPAKSGGYWYNDPQWFDIEKVYGGSSSTAASWRVKVNYNYTTVIDQPVDPNQLSTFNSIFDDVRGNTIFYDSEHEEGKPKYIAYSNIIQDTKKTIKGGSSGLIRQIWKVNADDSHVGGDILTADTYPALSRTNLSKYGTTGIDGIPNGPRQRQEVVMAMYDVPCPVRTHSGNQYADAYVSTLGNCHHDVAIEMDINFDLEYAHNYHMITSLGGGGPSRVSSAGALYPEGSDPNYVTLRRSMLFCMSDEAPTDEEDLYTFLSHNYIYNWKISAMAKTDIDGTSGDTHTKITIDTTGVCGSFSAGDQRVVVGDRVYMEFTNSGWTNCGGSKYRDDAGTGTDTDYFPANGFVVTFVSANVITIDLCPGTNDPTFGSGSGDQSETATQGTLFKYSPKNFFGMAFVRMSGKTPDIPTEYNSGANFRMLPHAPDMIWKTDWSDVICLPFHGNGTDETHTTLPTGNNGLLSGQIHGWIPNANLMDFVHTTGMTTAESTHSIPEFWLNSIKNTKWQTIGWHWNVMSGGCMFNVRNTNSDTEIDFADTWDDSNDLPTASHPESDRFMPNMRADSTGKHHGNLIKNCEAGDGNWPSQLSIWGCNTEFKNTQSSNSSATNTTSSSTIDNYWIQGEDAELTSLADGIDTRNEVNISELRLIGFNLDHENSTVSMGNKSKTAINFKGGNSRKMFHHPDQPLGKCYFQTTPMVNYISLGFNTRHDIESAKRYLLWNGFDCPSITALADLDAGTSAAGGHLRISFTSDELRGFQINALNEHGITQYYNPLTTPGTTLTISTPVTPDRLAYPVQNLNVGMLVTGYGITWPGSGDPTYITSINPTAGTITVNQNVSSGVLQQQYTFFQGKANLDIAENGNFWYEGYNSTEKFTGKGFTMFNFVAATCHKLDQEFDKRENIAASARVVGYVDDEDITTVEIDDSSIFELDSGEEYIMYIYGQPETTSSERITGIKVLASPFVHPDRFFKLVELNKKVNNLGGTGEFKNEIKKGRVFISPYRFWITMEVCKRLDADTYIAENSYTSVLVAGEVSEDGTDSVDVTANTDYVGTTYNESVYNDTDAGGQTAPYLNRWSFAESSDFPVFEIEKDYGYGVWESENQTGGQIYTWLPSPAWNEIFLKDVLLQNSEIEPEDTVSFLIKPYSAGIDHGVTFRAKEHGTASSRPFLLTGYFDSLPKGIKDFRVAPFEDNAFYPEFTWSPQDKDLWYAFIIQDNESIPHQYKNAIIHYPFNETGIHGDVAADAVEQMSALATDNPSGGPLYDVEGLAGYCLRFDGSSGNYVRAGTGSADPLASATDEMSVVVHAVRDNTTRAEEYLISQAEKFVMKMNVAGQIVVQIHADANSYVELTSSSLVPIDDQTPINIIVTFDKDIKSSNAKLFIDGILEDQSGPLIETMADGSGSTGWAIARPTLHTNNDYMYIGNSAAATSDGFKGRLEEIVIYDRAIYPVVPEDQSFLLTKPLEELYSQDDAQSKTFTARLFIKDYHNIRGRMINNVSSTEMVTWRKAGFALDAS